MTPFEQACWEALEGGYTVTVTDCNDDGQHTALCTHELLDHSYVLQELDTETEPVTIMLTQELRKLISGIR